MFNPSRDEARRFFLETWQKHKASQPLTDLERMTLAVLIDHPEYHRVLDAPDRFVDHDWRPEAGETNPFLHFAMHLSIEEQLSIDQPTGVRAGFEALVAKLGDAHAATHEVMDCLGEMIWHAQRHRTPPVPNLYLQCMAKKAGREHHDTLPPLDITTPGQVLPPRG